MKKSQLIKKITTAVGCLAFAIFVFGSPEIGAQTAVLEGGGGGNLEFVPTSCVRTDNGDVLGPSNDCKTGTSNCFDNDCSRFIG